MRKRKRFLEGEVWNCRPDDCNGRDVVVAASDGGRREEEEEEQGIGRLGLVTVTGAARDGSNALEDEATHEQEPLKAIIIIEMRYKGRLERDNW